MTAGGDVANLDVADFFDDPGAYLGKTKMLGTTPEQEVCLPWNQHVMRAYVSDPG
jgi:hypothetical protein